MPSLRSIEKEAYYWADHGIDTMEQAAVYTGTTARDTTEQRTCAARGKGQAAVAVIYRDDRSLFAAPRR